eukprot:TRINITY_DN9298_c0_g1_i1.p1 TRINITY_DN9298_c0_g1~~TRINITY_DN9298_c0_g1_i1.p1  ORF type:complete len:275 (-),score=49.97 TRINITY_DN9298_c0_g1_i1:241-1065(-)
MKTYRSMLWVYVFLLMGEEAQSQGNLQFRKVDGSLKVVAVGDYRNGVWGVNSKDEIFVRTISSPSSVGQRWKRIDGALSFISVGSLGEVWGVNSGGRVYKREGVGARGSPSGTKWTEIKAPKPMKQLEVYNGVVWAIGTDDSIWYRIGNDWRKISGGLKVVSVGKTGVWGVNSKDEIYYRQGTSVDPRSAGTGWEKVSGGLSYMDVPFEKAVRQVWGVNSEGKVYRKKWSEKNEIYPNWEQMGANKEFKQLNVAEGSVWAVAKDGSIWQAPQRG